MRIFIVLVTFSCLLASCARDLDVKIPTQKSLLVINSVLNPDSGFVVHVSQSIGALDYGNTNEVTNAKVEIYDNGSLLTQITNNTLGYYESTYKPVAGHTYQVQVSDVNYPTASATLEMPADVPIQIVSFFDSVPDPINQGSSRSELSFSFQDDAATADFYKVELFIEDSVFLADTMTHTLVLVGTSNGLQPLSIGSDDYTLTQENQDALRDGNMQSSITFSDGIINGKSATYKIFGTSLDFSQNGPSGGPGGPPPVIDQFIHHSHVFFRLSHITESLFKYTRSLNSYYQSHGNPFSDPVQVTNNIIGGYGIWGARNGKMVQVK